ncbi:MAG: DUF4105 domain-containing protein [Pirellulales bacterium]
MLQPTPQCDLCNSSRVARRGRCAPRRELSSGFAALACVAALLLGAGCKSVEKQTWDAENKLGLNLSALERATSGIPLYPSHQRDWAPQHSRLPSVEFDGSKVAVHDVRNFDYITESEYIARFEDRKYDLRDLETVDYIVVPFAAAPLLAHTMLSFGFGRDQYLVTSVEVRLEKGESYSPLLGAMRQFEIMYVLADERDAIKLRTEVRKDDVYVYRVKAPPEKVRELFIDVAERVNQIHDAPEFYDTLTNNCTTNIVQHVNRIAPNSIPYGGQVLLPGMSGQLAYNLGLLDRSVPYDELQRRSNVTARAHAHRRDKDFSREIRR